MKSMGKNIVIIQGHPNQESYCAALADAYEKGAAGTGAVVRRIDVGKLQFESNLKYGFQQRMELEDDLLTAQDTIRWADHLVFVYPVWWGAPPAILKGFIDRAFLPGFAFKYRENSKLWDKLLKGKTARLIITMDSPSWFYTLVYKKAAQHMMKRAVLEFCGVKPVKVTQFNEIKTSNPLQRERWLQEVQSLGSTNG